MVTEELARSAAAMGEGQVPKGRVCMQYVTIATKEHIFGGGTMKLHDRRALLKFLAASPLLAQVRPGHASADEPTLASAAEALDVFDLEAVAQKQVPLAHWGYLQSGVDGEVTLRANATAF